jgi:hypothetical protein
MPQVQGDCELQGIERVQVMRQAMLLEKSVSFLEMSREHPHNDGPATPQVGKEPPSKQCKVGCRNYGVPHFLGKDRDSFHHTQARNV